MLGGNVVLFHDESLPVYIDALFLLSNLLPFPVGVPQALGYPPDGAGQGLAHTYSETYLNKNIVPEGDIGFASPIFILSTYAFVDAPALSIPNLVYVAVLV